jgi:MATE family multidrug resistance protein
MLCYVFIIHYELSYVFIGWAYVFACAMRCVLVFLFSYNLDEVQRTLCRPSMKVFDDWGEFLSLGLPGCVMLCAEWWAFEILTAFAGLLSAAAVDAQSIILQISVLIFMFPFGVAMATASLVGNALGAGEIQLARRIGFVSMSTVFVMNAVLSVLLLKFGQYCIEILTVDPEVIKVTVELLPFLAVFLLFDGQQGVACGVLRGVGKQEIGAYLGLIGYYCIGMPAAWYLAFHVHLGVSGLMIGISASTLFLCVALYWYLLCNDDKLYVPLKGNMERSPQH